MFHIKYYKMLVSIAQECCWKHSKFESARKAFQKSLLDRTRVVNALRKAFWADNALKRRFMPGTLFFSVFPDGFLRATTNYAATAIQLSGMCPASLLGKRPRKAFQRPSKLQSEMQNAFPRGIFTGCTWDILVFVNRAHMTGFMR